jgi:hypothetical protein
VALSAKSRQERNLWGEGKIVLYSMCKTRGAAGTLPIRVTVRSPLAQLPVIASMNGLVLCVYCTASNLAKSCEYQILGCAILRYEVPLCDNVCRVPESVLCVHKVQIRNQHVKYVKYVKIGAAGEPNGLPPMPRWAGLWRRSKIRASSSNGPL